MNWAIFALSVFGALFAAWLFVLVRRRWSPMGLIVSLALLLVAGLNAAAPVRGYVDPDYVGYGFGLAQADRGLAVTLTAGAIFLSSVIAAFTAISARRGPALLLVAAVSAALAVILGVPVVMTALTDPARNAIQFGEYLTIPGLAGTALLLLLLVVPFVLGALWALRAAFRPPLPAEPELDDLEPV